MSSSKFRVKRIDTPSWAEGPTVDLTNLEQSEFQKIQQHRQRLLGVVEEEVEAYLNTEHLVGDEGVESFPSLTKMTGEYYLANEFYDRHRLREGTLYVIGVKTRFLEKPWYDGQDDFDYLGLDVWVQCDPDSWTFSICRNTDSSVI